jgi:hypothetical protein
MKNSSTNKFVFLRALIAVVSTSALIFGLGINASEAAPANPIPKIVGNPTPGSNLSVNLGTWPAKTTFTYFWLADGEKLYSGYTVLEGEMVPTDFFTNPTMQITNKEWHQKISVQVTATKPGSAPVTVTSAQTATVTYGQYPGAKTPTITSSAKTPVVGSTLTAKPNWPSVQGVSTEYSYQWQRDGKSILEANESTYVVRNNDSGKKISVVVDAVGRFGDFTYEPTPKSSAAITISGKAQSGPKTNVPTITGETTLGGTLTAVAGNYPAGTSISYLWLANGKTLKTVDEEGWPLPPYTESTLSLTDQMLGAEISVQVIARIPSWDPAVLVSKTTDKINQGVWTQAPIPELTLSGRPVVGALVGFTMRPWLPTAKGTQPIFKYQWMRNSTPIAGATAKTYKLVAADKGCAIWVKITGTGSQSNGIPFAPTQVSAEQIWASQ